MMRAPVCLLVFALLFHSSLGGEESSSGGRCEDLSGSGTISSPNYPEEYDDNTNACWVLRADAGYKVQLTFTDFELESSGDCNYDYVNVYNDIAQESMQGCKRCGTGTPRTVVSTGEVMVVTFVSDSSVRHAGFQADFSSVDVESVPEDDCRYGPLFEQIPIPPEGCDEPELLGIIKGLLSRVQDLPHRAYEELVALYYRAGVDITTEEGLQGITCYIASVSTVEELAMLFPGARNDDIISGYRHVMPILKTIEPQSIRQGLVVARRLLNWVKETGFPSVPLYGSTYLDTWQFFTELQADLPEALIADINVINSIIMADVHGIRQMPLAPIYTETPEALARVCHADDEMDLYAMFAQPEQYYNILDSFRHIRVGVLHQIEALFAPVVVSGLELVEHLAVRGWLDF